MGLPKVLGIQLTVYYGFTEACEKIEFPDRDSALELRQGFVPNMDTPYEEHRFP